MDAGRPEGSAGRNRSKIALFIKLTICDILQTKGRYLKLLSVIIRFRIAIICKCDIEPPGSMINGVISCKHVTLYKQFVNTAPHIVLR